ncbi:exported hypothetical protein [uncultured Dysgonomonas sp.]|uniref:Uncharacterized protein n=2 Tax=uncultured Dysgonomonas sp. TaxID=206096 RepID=A0A212JFH2_9BACT|nr:exported hypothetical protein [uncultured Dysgonomonas sp.]
MQVGNKQKLIIMKKLINIFTLFALFAMMFVSCSPDDYSLGSKNVKAEDLVEGIAFKIEHDASNPNIIYLTSLMGNGYTPLWNHPQGRSQKQKVTLKMPFPGTYNVTFGVETPGGIVYGEPVTFTVDDFYADFVNDDVWTMISGGVGKSKTWYLDLDAEGVSRHFLAPMYFFTGTYNWDALHTASGDNYLDADAWDWKKAITPLAGDDGNALWYWLADWPGNKWMCDAADFGTMTFDLIGGANIKVDQQAYGLGSYNGSYMVNVDEHTIAFTDAYPVNVTSRNGEVLAATEFRILYLSEDFMQIMLVPSGTCFNYISKEYKDNWVAGDPEPPYNGNANDDLTSTFTKKWKLSVNTPYNWTGLDGTFLNNWSSSADYSVAGYPYNKSMIDNISLSMTKTGEKTGSYILTDGTAKEMKGTYKTDANNNIIFDTDISFAISGSQMLSTTGDKALRIIRSEKDESGELSGLWLGRRDNTDAKYMVYHFELMKAASEDEGTSMTIDQSKIVHGDLESNGNLRIEIYNAYGSTAASPPVKPSDFIFDKSISVTFTLGGVTLKTGAIGSYKAALSFADGDWSAQYWGGGSGDTNVSGNGTYTVWCAPGVSDGLMVFTVDVKDLANDIVDLNAVTVKVDKITIK